VSSLKSRWPGVSRMFTRKRMGRVPVRSTGGLQSKCIAELETEMPRCFSSSSQSLVACRAARCARTAPASRTAPP
jgi:hypothetical protein